MPKKQPSLKRSILVVGAGINGLQTAIHTKIMASSIGEDVDVKVFEKRDMRGSGIHSHGTSNPWGSRHRFLTVKSAFVANLKACGVDVEGNSRLALYYQTNGFRFDPAPPVELQVDDAAAVGSKSEHISKIFRRKFPYVASIHLASAERSLREAALNVGVRIFDNSLALRLEVREGEVVGLFENQTGERFDSAASWAFVADGGSDWFAERDTAFGIPRRIKDEVKRKVPILAGFFGNRANSRKLQVHGKLCGSGPTGMAGRFDGPGDQTMVVVRQREDRCLSNAEASEYLRLAAAGEFEIPDDLISDPIRFNIRLKTSPQLAFPRGRTPRLFLIGQSARLATPFTGSGAQIGSADAVAAGILIRRLMTNSEDCSYDMAVESFLRGRQRSSIMLQRRSAIWAQHVMQ